MTFAPSVPPSSKSSTSPKKPSRCAFSATTHNSFPVTQRTSQDAHPYADGIYMWMALDFFRQWFAQNISNGNNRKAPDGGYEFNRQISLSGPVYLDHEDFRNFHQFFPISSKACSVLERDMGVLKEDVKPFVQDLMKSHVHCDVANNLDIKWLTCTVVNKEDCPWVKKEKAQKEEAAAAAVQKEKDEQMFFEDGPLPVRGARGRSIRDVSSSPILERDPIPNMEMTDARTYHTSDANADADE